MKVPVYTADFDHGICGGLKSINIVPHGYVEIEEFDAEKVFDLCNWSCWTKEKPSCVHSDIDWIGHGLIVVDERKDKWHPVYHLALSTDWLVGDYYTIQDYLSYHMHGTCMWLKEMKFEDQEENA